MQRRGGANDTAAHDGHVTAGGAKRSVFLNAFETVTDSCNLPRKQAATTLGQADKFGKLVFQMYCRW